MQFVKIHTLTPPSLPTPRRRNLRLHRRVDFQQHPDLQPAVQSPRRRPFGSDSRGSQPQRSVSAGRAGEDRAVLYGWLESCVFAGGGAGGMRIAGQSLCAVD